MGVQAALRAQDLRIMLSTSAEATVQSELMWDSSDVNGFIQCLHPARYINSEWGLPAGHNGKVQPLAADAYVMGFNRFKGEENQRTTPWVYFKFAVRPTAKVMLVLSAHPERKS